MLRTALPASERLAGVGTEELTAALLAALRFTAFDDARPAIAAARSRGLRVVVASNWDVSLHEVLDRLELRPLLDGVVTSAEVGARKPAPAVFARALRLAARERRRGGARRRQHRGGCRGSAGRRDRADPALP